MSDLSELDPQVRDVLLRHARTVAHVMLLRRGQPRPNSLQTLHLPRGNAGLVALHRFADTPELLIAVLATAVKTLTEEEPAGHWTISQAATDLVSTFPESVMMVLHPLGLDLSTLDEVPIGVRIFRLQNVPPYDMWEVEPYDAHGIAEERKSVGLRQARNAAYNQRKGVGRRLFVTVQAEFRRQQPDLADDIAQEIKQLLADAVHGPMPNINLLLQAAGILGIMPMVTAGFTQSE